MLMSVRCSCSADAHGQLVFRRLAMFMLPNTPTSSSRPSRTTSNSCSCFATLTLDSGYAEIFNVYVVVMGVLLATIWCFSTCSPGEGTQRAGGPTKSRVVPGSVATLSICFACMKEGENEASMARSSKDAKLCTLPTQGSNDKTAFRALRRSVSTRVPSYRAWCSARSGMTLCTSSY